jgi:hypothetical protein
METKLRSIFLATVPGKKDDPNYAAIRGHVPIDLYKKFKFFCVERGVDNSQGLEDLLQEYFECKEQQNGTPASPGGKTKSKG